MKKTISLLLALIMIISLFAACGEKTPKPASDGAAQSQTGDPSASANASDAQPDDEEVDKEATETVSATGEVTIPDASSPDTQTGSGAQTAPGAQTPSSQTSPSAQTPSQTTPASALRGLIPASGKLENPKNWKEEHTVLFFGDGFISANMMGDTFIMLAEADGIKINCPANFT
ncbi:MAG: hypothetical protein IJS65_06770, partial [Clostridia bacterium]|nr:hypothetical protein [Clostridia bacterium]